MNEEGSEVPLLETTIPSATSTQPSLDLTLAVGTTDVEKEPETIVEIADSASEAEDGTGGFGPF